MAYKTSKSLTHPNKEKCPDWTKEQVMIKSASGHTCRITKLDGLLPYIDFKIEIGKDEMICSLDGQPIYGVDKKEFAKLFNEFVNAVAGEFNIDIDGYVADETQD